MKMLSMIQFRKFLKSIYWLFKFAFGFNHIYYKYNQYTLVEKSVDNFVVLKECDFKIKKSNIENGGNGLFTKIKLCKGIIYMVDNNPKLLFTSNDYVANIMSIYNAKNSVETYLALNEFRKKYYDDKKIQQHVNVRFIKTQNLQEKKNNQSFFFEILQDVLPGDELFRYYGFSIWMHLFTCFITNKNAAGFYKFLTEHKSDYIYTINSPDIEIIISKLLECLTEEELTRLDLNLYDFNHANNKTLYINHKELILADPNKMSITNLFIQVDKFLCASRLR